VGQALNSSSNGPAEEPVSACPACGGTESRTLFTAGDRLYRTTTKTFAIVECRRCRLLRLNPWPDPAELRRYYPENYWYVPEMEAAGQWVERYRRTVLSDHTRFVSRALGECGESGPILDVGCGGGLFLRLMAERGLPVFGLDFCLEAASVAWTNNRVPAVCGSLSRAPFMPGGFAAVTMFHVLEHLYEPASYLASAHELLKPDGRLIVQVPNAQCWQFLLLGENWIGLDVPRHLMTFRPRELEVLLDQCGFEVLRTKYFSLRDNPAGMATSIAPWLDPMARRIRRIAETPNMRLFKDLLYGGLTAACLPFAMLEAACHAGSTIMVEARKKS
jgi:2-polyprenyl-3-methyl-5-hydroxy-6-metoxy-1,4-benzoquinol methylase